MLDDFKTAMNVNDKLKKILIKQEIDTYDNGLEPLADIRYRLGNEVNEEKAVLLNKELIRTKLQAEI